MTLRTEFLVWGGETKLQYIYENRYKQKNPDYGNGNMYRENEKQNYGREEVDKDEVIEYTGESAKKKKKN